MVSKYLKNNKSAVIISLGIAVFIFVIASLVSNTQTNVLSEAAWPNNYPPRLSLSCQDCSANRLNRLCFNRLRKTSFCTSGTVNDPYASCVSCPLPSLTRYPTRYPTLTSYPKVTPTIYPKPTCVPPPPCVYSEPRCLLPEPIGGWCPSISPTPQLNYTVLYPPVPSSFPCGPSARTYSTQQGKVIQTYGEWKVLYDDLLKNCYFKSDAPQIIDFDKQTMIAVFAGSSCVWTNINVKTVKFESNKIIVNTVITVSGCSLPSFSDPFTLIAVDKTNLPIEFTFELDETRAFP